VSLSAAPRRGEAQNSYHPHISAHMRHLRTVCDALALLWTVGLMGVLREAATS
jgi:hypothetical protein